MRRRNDLRLRVDPCACDGFGHCAELAPELLHLDEWGFPVPVGGPLDRSVVPLARKAVKACPRNALFVERTPQQSRPAARRSTEKVVQART